MAKTEKNDNVRHAFNSAQGLVLQDAETLEIVSFQDVDNEISNEVPKAEICSSVELITPEIAKAYLSTQRINRNPSETRIRDYSSRMLNGEWKISQPIQFTVDGDLFDGQHRLMAVIRSGMAIEFLVVRGLPAETRYYVDIGQARRAAQIGVLMGVGTCLPSKLATCKAMFIGSELKPRNKSAQDAAAGLGGKISRSFSPHKLIELYEKHRDAIDFADHCYQTAPVRAVIARAYYHENHFRLRQFIEVVNTGYPTTECDDSAIALKNVITEMKTGKQLGGSQSRVSLYRKTISALSNFISKKNIRFVKEKEIEMYPLPDFD